MSAKHVNAVIVPSSRCAALPSLRRKDGGADIRVALLEAGFQEGDLVSIGMETIPPDEQLEQARAAAKENGEEVTRLSLENARLAEKLKHAGDFTCGPDLARLEVENTRLREQLAKAQENAATLATDWSRTQTENTRLGERLAVAERIAGELVKGAAVTLAWLMAPESPDACPAKTLAAAVAAARDAGIYGPPASDNAPICQPGGAA